MYNKNSLLKVYLYFKWIVIEYARALKNRRVRCWKTFTKMCLPANIYLFKVKYRNIKKRWETCSKLIINPANIYLFKVNNRNTRKRCEICSTLTIKTPEWYQWCHSGVFSVNFEHTCWRTVNFVNFEQCWRTIEFDLIHLFIFHLGWGTLLCWGGRNIASQPICSECTFSLPS